MSNKSLYKVGLAAAILSTIGWLAFIAAGNPDYSEISGLELFQAWQNNRSGWLLQRHRPSHRAATRTDHSATSEIILDH